MVVKHSSQQVVRCADGVHIAGEMQVDVFHGNNLSVSATCSAALYAEYRAQRRLTKSYHNILAQLTHTICQTNCRSGLAFACRSGVDCGNKDQLAILAFVLSQQIVINLGLVLSVMLQILLINTSSFCDLVHGEHFSLLCDLNVRLVTHYQISFSYSTLYIFILPATSSARDESKEGPSGVKKGIT